MTFKRLCAALAATCALSGTLAIATPISSFSDIDFWVGSGDNRAGMIVEFNDGNSPSAYTWGYRFDDSEHTGEDMFLAIVAADPRLSAIYSFGGLGLYVSNIQYDAGVTFHDSGDEWFTYYVEDTASPTLPGSWIESGIGASSRTLSNNSWDVWSATVDFDWPGAVPSSPVSAIPEPGTLVLLSLTVGGLLWWRRRFRA